MSRGGRNRNRSRKNKQPRQGNGSGAQGMAVAISQALRVPIPKKEVTAPEKQRPTKPLSFDKDRPHVPTAFLWQLLRRERMATAPHARLVDAAGSLIHAVYPGIEYQPSQTDMILNDLVRPELEKKYADTLVRFQSEAQALSVCGNCINVETLRRCEGAEWEMWHLQKQMLVEARKEDAQYAALVRQWELVA